MALQLKDPGTISFAATIHQGGHDGGSWVVFPCDLKETYGKGNLVPVVATFDGVEYRGSIAKMGGEALLLVRKAIRERLGKSAGDEVQVTVALDANRREVQVPEDLRKALSRQRASREMFEMLSYSHQREYVEWIESAKRAETRETRVAQAVQMLREGKRLR